jgi:predicted acetyltransferase
MPELVAPTVAVRESFLAAMAEFAEEGRRGDNSMIGRDLATYPSRWETPEGFAAYIEDLRLDALDGTPRRPGFVPQTTLWWVEGYEYLGRLSIRHRLTPTLLEMGGHIGYDVRASARRRGHASAMLDAALPIAHGLGIDPALITCDATNVGSRRVIERNGGVLERIVDGELHYRLSTADHAS